MNTCRLCSHTRIRHASCPRAFLIRASPWHITQALAQHLGIRLHYNSTQPTKGTQKGRLTANHVPASHLARSQSLPASNGNDKLERISGWLRQQSSKIHRWYGLATVSLFARVCTVGDIFILTVPGPGSSFILILAGLATKLFGHSPINQGSRLLKHISASWLKRTWLARLPPSMDGHTDSVCLPILCKIAQRFLISWKSSDCFPPLHSQPVQAKSLAKTDLCPNTGH